MLSPSLKSRRKPPRGSSSLRGLSNRSVSNWAGAIVAIGWTTSSASCAASSPRRPTMTKFPCRAIQADQFGPTGFHDERDRPGAEDRDQRMRRCGSLGAGGVRLSFTPPSVPRAPSSTGSALRLDAERLRALAWKRFEIFVTRCLAATGVQAALTGPGADGDVGRTRAGESRPFGFA